MSRTLPAGPPPVIVTGTGRCGSTMISDLLARHPEVLSVSELFTAIDTPAVPGPMTGADFWALLCRLDPWVAEMVRGRIAVREKHYPFGTGRYRPESGIPAICLLTLPHLTDDPDGLFDRLAAEVPRWGTAPAEVQYRRLFQHLATILGRRVIVERSGGSLRFLDDLLRIFPDARVVHLHRDGPDTALSMSRHPAFAILARLTELRRRDSSTDLRRPDGEDPASLPPGRLTAEAPREPVPLAPYGRLWSLLLLGAEPHLAALPPDRLLALDYRDLVAEPMRHLVELARFGGFEPDPAWLRDAARSIRPGRTGAAAGLPEPQRRELRRSCLIGQAVLHRLGHH
jgi:hypothetical protein